MHRLRLRLLTRADRDERGFSIVLASLLLIPLLLMSGLAIDLGAWYLQATKLGRASEAAALAGAGALPEGETEAVARALEIAAQNGFVDGEDGILVVADVDAEGTKVAVTITDEQHDQYFTSVVREPGLIERGTTAEYVRPVPLGSPRNYLGTREGAILGGTVTGAAIENFKLSVSGPCTPREHGDRITPRTYANFVDTSAKPKPDWQFSGCTPGDNGHVRANPEYAPEGYLFGVTVPEASGSAPVKLDVYDAPYCSNPDKTTKNSYGDEGNTFDTRYVLRKGDAVDPRQGTKLADYLLAGTTAGTGHCTQAVDDGEQCPSTSALMDCWAEVPDVTLAPGDYYLEVIPVDGGTTQTRHNNIALRARRNGTFAPCSSDPTSQAGAAGATNAPYSPTCPQVYATKHLPVQANVSGANPSFYLADVSTAHSGKTMLVELYDAAEGAEAIELLDPSGKPHDFEWKIVCADGSQPDPSCPGEQDPPGGRGGVTAAKLNVAGSAGIGERTTRNNSQGGKYSDRIIQLRVELPDIAEAYGSSRWWRIRYTVSSSNFNDRTTWSIRILGDPIRLVPNR